MAGNECKTCANPQRDEFEAVGVQALSGEISWREAARRLELGHHGTFKNHMENHYVAPPSATEQAMDEMDALIATSIEELAQQMRVSPPELKPFYAIAIRNMKGLMDTNVSQQHLINALKAIHEVTGMKLEQRLMLTFGQQMFGLAEGEQRPELPVIDVEAVEDESPR